jgi:cell volume regulation protein A
MELDLPEDLYIIMIKRGEGYIAPVHSTVITENDVVMLSSSSREKLIKLNEAINA